MLNKSTERWRKVLDVNLTGVMVCAREAARQMIAEKHGGTIVNFSSIAGYSPVPTIADYCVSKAGVVMLTKCMAAELGRSGIRVNAVAPGPVDTGMTQALIHREDDWCRRRYLHCLILSIRKLIVDQDHLSSDVRCKQS